MMNRWMKRAYTGAKEGRLAEDKKRMAFFSYRPEKSDLAFD